MPKRTDINKILIIGAGPIIISQACEFDYSGTQACKALKEEGYEVVLINSNPATIMTDPETADRTYIEPVTPEAVEKIIEKERPDAILPTLGGQTGLNTAIEVAKMGVLEKYNVEMIGATVEAINKAEDRDLFRNAMNSIGLRIPRSGIATTMEEARAIAEEIKFPVIIRPSFTLGGTGGGVAYNPEDLELFAKAGLDSSLITQIMIEESIIGWKEFELEVMRDKNDNVVIVCSIENMDPMGIHTGDSITVAPIQTLSDKEYQVMRDASIAIIREIGVDTGGSNVQFATNPENGEIEDYTFKYIDIRFSNVCNFRCKYCSPRFSSTWYNFMKDESEKHPVVRAYVKNNPMEIDLFKVQDVTKENLITQLTPHLDTTQQVYFGGGEPLITEEHYELLDVMMSKDLYDIHLRYNTNLSNFKYKKKHIFDYWENFQYLTIGCSLDHFGKKAEFMRTKTDWKVEEENLRELIKFRSNHYEIWGPHEELGDSQREHTKKWGKSGWVIISIDTVITIFNVGSITDFWDYLLDEKLLDDQMTVTINVTYTPEYFTVRALPKHLKDEFSKKMYDWWENVDERHPKLKTMKDVAGNLIKGEFKQYIDTIHNIMHSEDIWDEDLFFWKIKFLDPDMTFKKILPELSDCVDMDALADKVSDEAFMIASPTTLLK